MRFEIVRRCRCRWHPEGILSINSCINYKNCQNLEVYSLSGYIGLLTFPNDQYSSQIYCGLAVIFHYILFNRV